MTVTLPVVEIAEPVAVGTASASVLDVLHHAVSTCAELDPDRLHSTSVAGRAVISLASLARSAVAAVGGDPGVALHEGPGVVVLRDLVHAVTLLERATAAFPESIARPDPDGLGAAAVAAYAVLTQVTHVRA